MTTPLYGLNWRVYRDDTKYINGMVCNELASARVAEGEPIHESLRDD